MRDTEAICVTRDIESLGQHEYASRYYFVKNNEVKDFEGQCKIDISCTCKRLKRKERYFNSSRQVYRSQRYIPRDFTDVGVGSVKTVCKKRVKRIYLPETEDTAVGSSDLSFALRTRNCRDSYCYQKKTSSKCVGDTIEYINVVNKKLSPIIKKISGSTSPKLTNIENSDTSSNTEKESSGEHLQMNKKPQQQNKKLPRDNSKDKMLDTPVEKITNNVNKPAIKNKGDGKISSSDSLIQHVHNLENPSNEKIGASIDLIENKLERDYRKIFTTDRIESNSNSKAKPISELKSASLLRRRFEALRRGVNRKEKQEVTIKISRKLSVPSRKDVSIASDPPSLESRSYSNTKVYSPVLSISNACNAPISNPTYGKPYNHYKKEEISNWPVDTVDSDCQDVKDMFRLWGEKFNLEEDSSKEVSKKQKKKVEITLPQEESNKKEKRKRFLFFRKKNKNKLKQPYRPKQGVTAGRCELGDGLMIKIGTVNKYTPEPPIKKIDEISQDNIIGKDWLKNFLSKKIDSRNSVRIRWNNSMYTTSSSTIFELMDCVYKNTGIIFSSKSEVTTGESSNHYSYLNPQVNFMQQNIQAWMIPKTITDKPNLNTSVNTLYSKKRDDKYIEIKLSSQRWFIEKSKGISRNIEFVLHSKNLVKNIKPQSSEYIVIDIPKGYFSETSSDDKNNHTSDEQVYNIVEYETLNSSSYLNKKRIENKIDSENYASKDIQSIVNGRDNEGHELKILDNNIDRQEVYTNVEASNSYIPKPCDVISVRIITQRDIRDIKKPILKINDHIDDKSVHILPPTKKCEVAESFLQDYYRNLTPLGIDALSWCVSSDKLPSTSESNSFTSLKNQGDGSKSCSNIYDGYMTSTIVSSCETSCSHCKVVEEEKKEDDSKTSKFFTKLIKRTFETTINKKRVSPKDSVEVFKRRKIYATSNKSKWGVNDDTSEPFFKPEKRNLNNSNECPKVDHTSSHINQFTKKKCQKHVLLQDCDVMDEILKEQLSDKIVEGILSFKGGGGCDNCKFKTSQHTKQAQVIPKPICNIPQPPCKESCIKEKNPSCSKKNSPTCHVPTPPSCPVGPPSPCQKPCPPSPPPCRMSPPCAKTPHPKSPSRSPVLSSSTECAQRKPMPPRIHSPKLSTPKRSRVCICPKKQSLCSIPKCPTSQKTSCTSTAPHLSKSTSRDSPLKCHSKSPCKSPCKSPSLEKCKKCSSHDFPWPLKSQQSNIPSKESGLNLKKFSPCPTEKSSNNCITAFKRLIQKVSSSSFKQKECRPDCANRRKVNTHSNPPAPPPTMVSVPTPTSPNKCRSKMLGLHLKKLPMPKSSSKDCLSQDESQGVIRLNSREKITIKLKQSTPSTEEIREGCNIKVQDEDGQTLYERRDYRKIDKNRMHFVKDMYRDSQVQRISTPDADKILDKKPMEINECKSDTSLSNIIEINLNLKFRQGDKPTEVNLNKSVDTLTKEPENSQVNTQHKSSKEIYVLQDKTKLLNEDTDKRDVNIKIMIKNYMAPVKLVKNKHSVSLSATDDFSKKISEKFNTVSTGYSDVIEKQTYSVHRATIDLTNSSDINKSLNKASVELPKKEVIDINCNDKNNYNCVSSVIKQINSSYIINDKEKESQEILTSNAISQIELNTSLEKIEVTNDDKSATSVSITNTDENINSDNTNLEDISQFKHRKYKKEEKKRILKQIFETASEIKKRKKTSEMKGIRQLLRAVLTSDSSDHENFEVNNKLAEELTYASLKPNFFKDSNSMTNYYLDKSSISTKVSSKNDSEELIYPTKENVSECSSSSDGHEKLGCLCSHLAKKLNMKQNNSIPCCCRGIAKIDEETHCDIREDDEKSNNIEIETQYSEYINNNSSKQNLLTQEYTSVYQYNNLKASITDSSEDKKDVTNSNFECNSKNTDYLNKKIVNIKPADVLQFNETKKAVLEIYAEKILSNEGKHMISRLPKFICEKESKIYKYQETFTI